MACEHGWRDEVDCEVCRPPSHDATALSTALAARIAQLEAALRSIAEIKIAVDIMTPDDERADECESKLAVTKHIARRALGV